MTPMPAESVRLRIGNLAKTVLVTGQTYQDPKDALNEFVSNAADEYVEAGRRGERIRVVLRRRGRAPVIAVDDVGRGVDPDRLRQVARNLFESSKAGDDRTLGEKAIGILAFQQLGGRCDIVSRAEGSAETWALRLERGRVTARLERERRRARQLPGTTVYLHGLEPDVPRVLTRRKVVDYLRARRGPALGRGDYRVEVVEGRSAELVTPERPDGIKLEIPARQTLWGRLEFSLYVAPPDGRRRRVAVVGRAGATIIDDICELEEFSGDPWSSDQVSGQIVFEALLQTDEPPAGARPDRRRARELPSVEPDPEPGEARSRFDEARGVVLYNDRHADYLLVRDDEPALLDYLATLVAKEYVLYNNARAAPADLTEEMVRMLVRVRRHLPRRRG
jgi:hypothetical protein